MNTIPILLTMIIIAECQMAFTNEVQNNRRISDLQVTENQEIQDIDAIKRRSIISEETYGTEVTRRIVDRAEDDEKAGPRIERLVKRVTVKELEHKLNVARKENRAQIKACGEKHNFKPFEQCKNCYQNCRGPRHCMRCRLVCLRDKNELNSKGCDIDKSKINALRQRINVLTGK
ncbi:uncharacterized protein LOC127708096 [Mytilus californianus]|uniref:uncharacterized protein LOC127708096 n=1 Tax=Mytilus californianus TaxID=6549 RepID=UPI0022474014|nr:uncharacterized protein LOC127708096 [Mytilus californianus]XP_052068884.1 uncharacterized protein LOC127708096 [Mytilus californianus]